MESVKQKNLTFSLHFDKIFLKKKGSYKIYKTAPRWFIIILNTFRIGIFHTMAGKKINVTKVCFGLLGPLYTREEDF